MLKFHLVNNIKIAEVTEDSGLISGTQDILDIMADAGYNGCEGFIVHQKNLHNDFFDLKTKLAGDILQKFSNYRMRLAIIGDFSGYTSKSLKDFIRESNRTGIISFVGTHEEALASLGNK
jgi:sugar phosphate isomerase/epimerase